MLDKLIHITKQLDKYGMHKEADKTLDIMVRLSQQYGIQGRPNQALGTPYPMSGSIHPRQTELIYGGTPWGLQNRQNQINKYQQQLQQHRQTQMDRMPQQFRAQMEWIVNRMEQKVPEQHVLVDKIFDDAQQKVMSPQNIAYRRREVQGYSKLISQVKDYFTRVMKQPNLANYIIYDFQTKPQDDPLTYFDQKLQAYTQQYPYILQEALQQKAQYDQMYQLARRMGLLPQIQAYMKQNPDVEFNEAYEVILNNAGIMNPMMMGVMNPMMMMGM